MVDAGLGHAGPEGDGFRAEDGGDVDRPLQEGDPLAATRGVGGDERRLVLGARVEQEARAGLDDGAEAEPVETAAQRPGVALPGLGEGIEMVVVERQGDAGVAGFGHEVERVRQAMAAAAVGVVGETQGHSAARACAAATWWASGSRYSG